MHDAAMLDLASTLTPSTATRLGKLMTDVRKHVELWWGYAGGTGGDSAVVKVEVHAPGVDGAGCSVEAVGKER